MGAHSFFSHKGITNYKAKRASEASKRSEQAKRASEASKRSEQAKRASEKATSALRNTTDDEF
jgi:hypothetical protein